MKAKIGEIEITDITAEELDALIKKYNVAKPMGRPPTPQIPQDSPWRNADWDKPNIQLACEYGVNPQTVTKYRNLYGHKAKPKVLREYDWSQVDWGKNNQQIAREVGCSIADARFARRLHNQPQHPARCPHGSQRVSEEDIAAADWEYELDSDLAKKWKVSRERVRQLRLELHKPECKLKHMQSVQSKEALRWLFKNRAEIEGKHAHDVEKMMPDCAQSVTKRAVMRKSGIKFNWDKHWKYGPNSGDEAMNWDLSNYWLQAIWKKPFNRIASIRYLHNAGKMKWRASGFSEKYLDDPEFLAAIQAEVAKANAAGVDVSMVEIEELMESRRNKARINRQVAENSRMVLTQPLAIP